MRPRAQSYRTLAGMSTDRDGTPWYWRMVALGSSVMILGGYLMLPATFDSAPQLRVAKSVLGIFAVALLTAGFSFSALVCFAVRNPLFQADAVFLPSFTSCALGLLTVFYGYLVSSRYILNTPAILVIIAASISTITYGGLLIWSHRRISVAKTQTAGAMPLRPSSISSRTGLWQDPAYHDNYVRNMFPASLHPVQQQPPPQPVGYDPNCITEEEMQRQQMLMLLLHREQPPTPDPSSSTFHIDWQGQEQEEVHHPPHGYYAPHPQSALLSGYPQSAYPPQSGISRQSTNEPAWDGVWRGPAPTAVRGRGVSSSAVEQWQQRANSSERREQRRREIELGR